MKSRLYFSVTLFILALVSAKVAFASANQKLVVFSGSSILSGQSSPGKCIAPDRLMICRNRTLTMQIEVDDARWSGEARLLFDSIYSKVPNKGYMHGVFNLENQGGSWRGTWKGSTDTQGNTFIKGEALGAGGYEGLVAHWQMNRSSADRPGQMSVNGSLLKDVSSILKR